MGNKGQRSFFHLLHRHAQSPGRQALLLSGGHQFCSVVDGATQLLHGDCFPEAGQDHGQGRFSVFLWGGLEHQLLLPHQPAVFHHITFLLRI